MSVLMCRDEENKETPKCPLLSNQNESSSPRNKHSRGRESSRHVNQTVEKEEVTIRHFLRYVYFNRFFCVDVR